MNVANLLFSINVVAPLFVLMAAGYGAKKIHCITDDLLVQLSRFVFRFCFPLMLFHDIWSSYDGDFSDIKLISAAVIGVVIVMVFFCYIVPLLIKQKGQRGSMIQGIYRSNFLIYGLPLATGIYGKEAVASISMLMIIIIPLYNISAVIILSSYSETREQALSFKNILKEIVQNPLIIGCFFGLLAGIFHLSFPLFVEKPLSQIAAASAPLALIIMGGEFRFKGMRNNLLKVLFVTFCRLIFIPVIAIGLFVYMGFRGVDLTVLLCIFATPTAIASYIMSKNMGCDGELSGQIVVLTTVCSSMTIFLFILVLRTMGLL